MVEVGLKGTVFLAVASAAAWLALPLMRFSQDWLETTYAGWPRWFLSGFELIMGVLIPLVAIGALVGSRGKRVESKATANGC